MLQNTQTKQQKSENKGKKSFIGLATNKIYYHNFLMTVNQYVLNKNNSNILKFH